MPRQNNHSPRPSAPGKSSFGKHPVEAGVRRSLSSLGIRRVIATVSGGPDSMALLAALAASGAEVTAAHCNFHLRGNESMRDQHHVERECERLGIPLHVKDFDVARFIDANPGSSTEMACRELRYAWFRSLMAETGADRIATGHNADDNIETLFLNLLRGSGTSGLKGMLPDNGEVWRPLLSFHRPLLEDYLEAKGMESITDSSNLQTEYRRNFLRNEVIPLLRSRWSGFDKALDRSLTILRSENRVVNAMVELRLPADGEPLAAADALAFPDPELLVRRFIEDAMPFTTTAGEVVAAMRAAKPDVARWKLKNGTLELRNNRLWKKSDPVKTSDSIS